MGKLSKKYFGKEAQRERTWTEADRLKVFTPDGRLRPCKKKKKTVVNGEKTE